MLGQHPFLFQHFNIMVVEQFVCVNDVLMMANSIEQQRVPWISGVQLPVSSLLQQHLHFLIVKLQSKGQCNHLIPRRVLLSKEYLIHVGFIQVGAPHHISFGTPLLL